ncbi:hypothetical protein [Metapseudomonas otitidis]|uniref:hypothetical protein n=1 Tax=Metapseudomonas otitidis TaxID=319939 RepID=UPI00366CB087
MAERPLTWLFGLGFLAIFIMFNVVVFQRDEARRMAMPQITTANGVITLQCPTRPDLDKEDQPKQ